jgi:hypothetical protein
LDEKGGKNRPYPFIWFFQIKIHPPAHAKCAACAHPKSHFKELKMTTATKLPAVDRRGRLSQPLNLTPAKIRSKAEEILRNDLSNLRNEVLELLHDCVVLSESTLFRLVYERVAISDNRASFHRRLMAYVQDGLIEPVSRGVLKQALRAGLPRPETGLLHAYRLGPVGLEVAKVKFTREYNAPLSVVETEEYQAHDLLCAEAMFKMQQLWLADPDEETRGIVTVRGQRRLTVWNAEEQKAILAPDGLMLKYDTAGVLRRIYLVEYHNTNVSMNVKSKVEKYETLADPKYAWVWQVWNLLSKPIIVALYRQPATLEHYINALKPIHNGRGVKAFYAAIALKDVWAGNLVISRIKYDE